MPRYPLCALTVVHVADQCYVGCKSDGQAGVWPLLVTGDLMRSGVAYHVDRLTGRLELAAYARGQALVSYVGHW